MKFTVRILTRASADADTIFRWLAKHSPQGAVHWYDALLASAALLASDPLRHPRVPEILNFPEEVREVHFKTRRGRRYRLLFVVVEDEVRILGVRGPGQTTVTPDDLR